MNLKEILAAAGEGNYGVGLFNFLNLETLRGILRAAEAEQSPLILGVAEVHLPVVPFGWAAELMRKAQRESRVPICLHFDHGMTKQAILAALEAGFGSVMYDGSALPFEENIKNTAQIVREARRFGASVEAELGHVGLGSAGGEDSVYTEPGQVAEFVERTGVDALAVAIGTAHGNYLKKPELDLNRLEEIRAACPVPLVLHGGSGLSDDDFQAVISGGIRKVNICTELCAAAAREAGKHDTLEEMIPAQVGAVADTVAHRMRVFGSAGKGGGTE